MKETPLPFTREYEESLKEKYEGRLQSKYLVYKNNKGMLGEFVEDAVVIRRQDIFAAPALEAYANAITCVIEVLTNDSDPSDKSLELQAIADYFHDQAEKSYTSTRKLPD